MGIYLMVALAFLIETPNFEELADMSLDELMNMVVVTASKSAQKSSDAPATVYVFSEATLRDGGYTNLDSLLETIPEIEIQHQASPEFSNWYTIRGVAGNNKFVVLLDGFRINSPTGSPHYIGKNYSLTGAKQVEIILGPASALYGADAFGGIINIITKTGGESKGIELRLSGGTESTREGSISYGYANERLSFTLDAQVTSSDESNYADLFPDEFAWYNQVYSQNGAVLTSPFDPSIVETGNPRPFAMPSKAMFIHAGLKIDQFEIGLVRNSESHSSSLSTRPEYNLYVDNAIYKNEIESIFAKHTYENGKFSLQSSLSRSTQVDAPSSNFQNTFTQYQRGYKYGYGKTSKLEEQINWQGTEHAQIVAGLSYEDITALARTGDLPFRFNPNLPADSQGFYYLGTNIQDRYGNDLTVFQQFYQLNYKNYGAYIQYQGTWDQFLVTLGLRYDDNTRYGSTVNPRFGIVYKPKEKWVLKGLYSEGFLAPSPYETFRHYGAFSPVDDSGAYTSEASEIVGLRGPFWHLPNPELKPEELSSTEFTLSYQITEQMAYAMDVYDTKIDQLIVQKVFVGSDPIYFPNGLSFSDIPVDVAEIPTNGGTMNLQGGSMRFDAVTHVRSLRVRGNLSYSYSDGDISGEKLTYSAKDTYRLQVGLSQSRISTNLTLLKRSRSFHSLTDSSGNHFSNPGFTRIDFFGQYKLKVANRDLTLFTRITNLLDKKHYNVGRNSAEGFPAAPQDPRRIEAGFSVHF